MGNAALAGRFRRPRVLTIVKRKRAAEAALLSSYAGVITRPRQDVAARSRASMAARKRARTIPAAAHRVRPAGLLPLCRTAALRPRDRPASAPGRPGRAAGPD